MPRMRRIRSFAFIPAFLAAAMSLTLSAPAAVPAQPAAAKPPLAKPSLEQFFKIRAPGAPVRLPDGSLLLRDWPDGVWQLYRTTPKDGSYHPSAATSTRITSFPDGLTSFSVSPDGRRVILMHSAGGNENTQLTLLDPQTGALSPILANPKVQAAANAWLRDSSGFIYSANDQSPSDFHLYRYDFASAKAVKLLAREGSWSAQDITRDGARVLVEQFISASNIACFELDVASGRLTDLTLKPDSQPTSTAASAFVAYLPADDSVLMTSDFEGGVRRVYLKDLKSGQVSRPLAALGDNEVDAVTFNDARDLLAVTTNEDGYAVPHVFALTGFTPLPSPKIERGVTTVADFRARTLVWTTNNARDPGAAFAATWPAPGPNPGQPPATSQLTWVDTQGLDLAAFPLPELIRYKAFDGLDIPAFLFLPPGFQQGKPIPFVVLYHGGPESQHRPTFSAAQQHLLSQGIGILLPNVRGSSGYGRQFQMLDDYRNRWDSVRDGVDAAEWLVARGYAQPGRIATYGGSYGGFMSIACLVEDQERVEAGRRPERLFGAGVDIVGIVNLKTFLERTAGYRRKLREAEYGPLSDPEFLLSVSSMSRIDKIKVPIFIAHGFNDPRVPVEEAMQLSIALKDRSVPVQLFVAPDEGHGFQKLQNRLYFGERVSAFLKDTIAR